ncbi:MAG TPA: mucoidy inhibitor MuiA family protein, partial [Acidobacteriota bacterium]|nr:mucoidy inhibitor MuiA family protein [Acidobacteriota bacterium]
MKLLRLTALLSLFAAALSAAPVDSTISAVTVYTDRAVVTRTATIELAGGQSELIFANLPESILDQSVQVSGRGTAQATILDVAARRTFVDFTPNARVKEIEDQLRALRNDDRRLADEVAVLGSQRDSINEFMKNAVAASKDAGRPKLEDVRATLEFGQKQLLEIAQANQKLDQQREELSNKIAALEQQLNELRGTGGKGFKTVVVRVSAAQAGNLELALSYTVGNARWTPSYDARVLSGERAVSLSYFGVVRQTTGEDWKNVALTLSTARPSLGGAAPTLTAWNLDVWVDRPIPVAAPAAARAEVYAARQKANAAREVNLQAFTTNVAADMAPPPPEAEMAGASVESGATSASFKIATASTIPSDGSAQKVPIAATKLTANPEYLTVPKRQQTAFLTTKVVNSTDFPLLAGAMNVFLDGTFVATSNLRTVMAGEKFDLALGADEGISVKHKRVQKFTEDTGLTNSGKRITYEYLLTIQNNKKTAERVIVVDQLPLSRNEKVVVKQLAPDAREVKPTDEGTLKWSLDLKPGEKREIELLAGHHGAQIARGDEGAVEEHVHRAGEQRKFRIVDDLRGEKRGLLTLRHR